MLTYDKTDLTPVQDTQEKESLIKVGKFKGKAKFQKKETNADKEIEGKIINKNEVLKVLNRAADDELFWNNLNDNGSATLENTGLNNVTKAAILTGDINWIQKHVGKLTDKELRYLKHRLETEKW